MLYIFPSAVETFASQFTYFCYSLKLSLERNDFKGPCSIAASFLPTPCLSVLAASCPGSAECSHEGRRGAPCRNQCCWLRINLQLSFTSVSSSLVQGTPSLVPRAFRSVGLPSANFLSACYPELVLFSPCELFSEAACLWTQLALVSTFTRSSSLSCHFSVHFADFWIPWSHCHSFNSFTSSPPADRVLWYKMMRLGASPGILWSSKRLTRCFYGVFSRCSLYLCCFVWFGFSNFELGSYSLALVGSNSQWRPGWPGSHRDWPALHPVPTMLGLIACTPIPGSDIFIQRNT